MNVDRSAWRLLPGERVLWQGQPTPGVPRDRRWLAAPLLIFAFAAVSALFAGLLAAAHLPGGHQTGALSAMMALFGVSVLVAPHYLLDGCAYLVTDRRILWRRGRLQRQIDRLGITFGRIRWHPSAPGVGHLELVRAVPFGPLARKQRLLLRDLEAPDVVFAIIRGVRPSDHAGDPDVPLAERLDPGEQVIWGDHPEGSLLGWRELATGCSGAAVLVLGLLYGQRTAAILLGLEEVGLEVRSWVWVFFFLAIGLTWAILVAVGVALLWHGIWRARGLGRATEYVLTDRRLLIRRGRTEPLRRPASHRGRGRDEGAHWWVASPLPRARRPPVPGPGRQRRPRDGAPISRLGAARPLRPARRGPHQGPDPGPQLAPEPAAAAGPGLRTRGAPGRPR